jgi:hypothetical protein
MGGDMSKRNPLSISKLRNVSGTTVRGLLGKKPPVSCSQNEQREKILYKNTHILKVILNVVTAGIEAPVISGNTFLYACVKAVCRLWLRPRSDTLHQLLIIAEALWSQPVLQVGKQVVVVRSEMLQQCSSASSCMRTHIVTETNYTGCQHCMPFVLNDPTQLFLCLAKHLRRYCRPLLHEFHHKHSFPVQEYSCHPFSGRQTTFI